MTWLGYVGDTVVEIPGLQYASDFLDEQREEALMREIAAQPWLTELRRRVQHYGYKYDYKARKVTDEMYLGPLPAWLHALSSELRDRGFMPKLADQVIVNEYEPGQGIAPHVDCVSCFAGPVASLTLGSSCCMEFVNVETRQKLLQRLERRSLLVLADEARYGWRHGIPPRKSDKYDGITVERGRRLSLTFRNVLVGQ